jgi:glucan endo-1,3-beta-D-glucosidase
LTGAIKQYGSKFTNLVVGVSVGSEDLYRSSELGIQAKAGIGADPTTIANYINQVKNALKGTSLGSVPVGHVDTWTAWYNTSNNAVIDASDFIGVDAYPYFQSTMSNPITSGKALFDQAIANVKSTTKGKTIWVTETGWPVSGPDSNEATANVENAKTYWDEVGCGELFGNVNTWWYTLQDALPSTPSPSFGLIGSGSTTPLFDLSCSNITSSKPTASVSSVTGSVTATATDAGSPGVTGFSSLDASAASITQVATVVTFTNSAGSTLATTLVSNQTVGATGTPIVPTASTTGSGSGAPVHTGGAVAKIGSIASVFGAAIAVVAAL